LAWWRAIASIEAGKNYGWPLVSYAVNYDGVPIPSPDSGRTRIQADCSA